jgi:futalosine hydrolase
MKILVVAATRFEIATALQYMVDVRNPESDFIFCRYKDHEVDFLITGVGMVATSYFTAKAINDSYDIAINAGICGSFNKNLELGDVVNVCEDTFAELGAEDADKFLTLEEMQLQGISKIINESGALHPVIESLPKVNGITVNTTHGEEKSIAKVYERLHPYVESMEGAAFMFVCDHEGIPYVQLRAVSNYVEKRNRDAWNIPLAMEKLNEKLIEILNAI